MARADWGSTSGDFSGMFASLQDQFMSQVQSATNRQIQRTKEEQAANDADMYDKYKNGQISDSEWLAYIQKRVGESAGDPTALQQWKQTYNDTYNQVKQDQIETSYDAGTATIHDILAYYADRMNSVKKTSPEYRDLSKRYYQLVDTRDANYIEDQSRTILAKINRGKTGYGELLKFYQGMLSKVRSSSSLYEQIKSNVQSIQDIVDGVSGGSGSRSGSGSGGGGGGGGGANDPYSTASRAVATAWSKSDVFSPGGPDLISSILDSGGIDTGSKTSVWNALAEDRVTMESILDYLNQNPNAKYIYSPGRPDINNAMIENTPDNRYAIMNQLRRAYDYGIALGNAEGRSVNTLITNRAGMLDKYYGPQNNVAAQQYWNEHRQDAWENVTNAAGLSDPNEQLKAYAQAGKILHDAAQNILGVVPVASGSIPHGAESTGAPNTVNQGLFPEYMPDSQMQTELDYATKLGDLFQKASSMDAASFQHEASILLDQRPSSFWLSTSELKSVLGDTSGVTIDQNGQSVTINAPSSGLPSGISGSIQAKTGLEVTYATNHGIPVYGTEEQYVYVAPAGSSAEMAVPVSQVNQVLGVDDYTDNRQAMGGWENVNGKVQWVIRPLQPVKPVPWYQNTYGQWMTEDQFRNQYHGNLTEMAKDLWVQKDVPGISAWSYLTDSQGMKWYRDPEDGHLYPGGPPFKANVLSGPDSSNIMKFVDSGGNLDLNANRLPASTGLGYVAYYSADVSSRDAERALEDMLSNPHNTNLDLSQFHPRDGKNNVDISQTIDPTSLAGSFWSPADQSVLEDATMNQNRLHAFSDRFKRQQAQQLLLERSDMRRRAQYQMWQDQMTAQANAAIPRNVSTDVFQQVYQGSDAATIVQQGAEAAGISLGNKFGQQRGVQKQAANPSQDYSPTPLQINTPPVDLTIPSVPMPPKQKVGLNNNVKTPPPPVAVIPSFKGNPANNNKTYIDKRTGGF